MRYVKKGWTMIILGDDLGFDCKLCGVYHADNRILRRFEIDFKNLERDVLKVSDLERVSYLKNDDDIVGVLKEGISLKEGKVRYDVELKAFKRATIEPIPVVETDLTDMMELRGFSGSSRRILKNGFYETEYFKIKVRSDSNLGHSNVEKGNVWRGWISTSFEIDFKKGPHSEIFSKTPPEVPELFVGTRCGPVPVAGLPWYSALFGRDLLVYSLQVVEHDPETVKRIIGLISKLQANSANDEIDSQPGKVFHEMRFSLSSVERKNPFGLYYGAVDATLLYPIVVWEYFGKTRDESVRYILPSVEKAIDWAIEFGDVDSDMFIEYTYSGALKNKGWKDSDDAIVHPDGKEAIDPIALVEVQGYLYGALISAYSLFESLEGEHRDEWLERAEELKLSFKNSFRAQNYFALALDGNKEKVMTPTSNPANCLFTGIYDRDDAEMVVDRIFEDDLMTPFGVRTMSSDVEAFDPVSYHRGTVWPHDNSLIFLGLVRYGFLEEAKELAKRVMRAKELFGGKLPELFVYVDGFEPLPYPGACEYQLWAMGAQELFERKLSEWGVKV